MVAKWVVGFLLESLGQLFNVCGKHLLRIAGKRQANYCTWEYQIGNLLMVTYVLFDLVAVRKASQAIVTACGGTAQAWNCLLAPFTVGEALTRQKLIGALVIAAGTVGAGSSQRAQATNESHDELTAHLTSATAICFYTLWALFQLAAWTAVNLGSPAHRGFLLAIIAGSMQVCMCVCHAGARGWLGRSARGWHRGRSLSLASPPPLDLA
ncbi:hypothetical protein OAO87_02535 [bacterium]|nr:hypothetical protein [bacterium]